MSERASGRVSRPGSFSESQQFRAVKRSTIPVHQAVHCFLNPRALHCSPWKLNRYLEATVNILQASLSFSLLLSLQSTTKLLLGPYYFPYPTPFPILFFPASCHNPFLMLYPVQRPANILLSSTGYLPLRTSVSYPIPFSILWQPFPFALSYPKSNLTSCKHPSLFSRLPTPKDVRILSYSFQHPWQPLSCAQSKQKTQQTTNHIHHEPSQYSPSLPINS